jgi:hypothetical protein
MNRPFSGAVHGGLPPSMSLPSLHFHQKARRNETMPMAMLINQTISLMSFCEPMVRKRLTVKERQATSSPMSKANRRQSNNLINTSSEVKDSETKF